jgi:hypothetical protein
MSKSQRAVLDPPYPRKPPKQRVYMQLPRVPFSLDFSGYPSIYKALSGCSQIEPKREPRVNRGRARRCNRGRRLLERHWLWPGRRGRSVDPRVRRPARTNRARLRGECRPPRQLRHPCKQGYPGSNLSIRDFVLGPEGGGGFTLTIEIAIDIAIDIAIGIAIDIGIAIGIVIGMGIGIGFGIRISIGDRNRPQCSLIGGKEVVGVEEESAVDGVRRGRWI